MVEYGAMVQTDKVIWKMPAYYFLVLLPKSW